LKPGKLALTPSAEVGDRALYKYSLWQKRNLDVRQNEIFKVAKRKYYDNNCLDLFSFHFFYLEVL